MLNVLPESHRLRRRATPSVVISAAVHAGIIGAVALAGASELPRLGVSTADTIPLVYTQSPRTELAKPVGLTPLPEKSTEHGPLPPAGPPLPSVDLTTVPEGIPPVDVGPAPVFAIDSTRVDVVGRPRAGEGAGTGAPLANEFADNPASALADNPSPRYPDMLRGAGVSGTVTMRFVIDTAGRVLMRTAQARHSDHELFTSAVLAALPRLRFVPAEANGRKVPVLVEQRYEFRLVP